MNIPMLPRRTGSKRTLREAGESTFGVLIALAIGSMVLMGFIGFWLNGRTAAERVVEATQKQSAGLSMLNRIADDVSDARGVVYADGRELVLENREVVSGVEQITRTRYFVNNRNELILERQTGTASSFPPGSTNWGSSADQQILATDIKSTVHGAQADGVAAVFRYVDRDGTTITDLPRDNLTGAGDIARIDIAYASGSGKAGGTQQVQTSATVASQLTGDKEPVVPACPVFRFTKGDPYPAIEWDPTGQTTSYNLYRDGTLIDTIPFTPGAEVMSTTDPAISGDTVTHYYVLTAVGPGGESGVSTSNPRPGICQGQTWYPRIQPPTVAAVVRPVTTESPQWDGSAYTGSVMEMSWPAVSGRPNGYQVYRRPINNKTFVPYDATSCPNGESPRNGWCIVGRVAPNAFNTYTEAMAWDSAFEWRVVSLGPMPEASVPSASKPGLAHTQRPGSVDVRPYSRGINQLTWTGEPGETATNIAIYRQDISPGCNLGVSKTWTRVAIIPKTQHTWYDSSAPASTLINYRVGAYNVGPRGDSSQMNVQYASMPTSADDALQWPANPRTDARGSLTGNQNDLQPLTGYQGMAPDRKGQNSVNWDVTSLGCTGTTDYYEVQQFGSSTVMANGNSDRPIASQKIPGGTSNTWTDPRGFPRASRAWYMVIAWNATGPSPNWDPGTGTPCTQTGTSAQYGMPVGCADPAFQFVNNFNDGAPGTSDDDPSLSITHQTGLTGYQWDVPQSDCETQDSRGYDVSTYQANQPVGSDTNGQYPGYPASTAGVYRDSYNERDSNLDLDGNGRLHDYPGDYTTVSQNNITVTRAGTEYACVLHDYFLNIGFQRNTVDNGPAGGWCGTWYNCIWAATAQITVNNSAYTGRYAGTVSPFNLGSSRPSTLGTGQNWESMSQQYRIGNQGDRWDAKYQLGNAGRPIERVQCNPGGCIFVNETNPPVTSTAVDAPVFRVYGSEGPDSRRTAAMKQAGEENPAYLGQNTIVWSQARGASTYFVYAYPDAVSEESTRNATGTLVYTAAGIPASSTPCYSNVIPEQRQFCFADTGARALPGAKTIYKVVASNGSTTAGNDQTGTAAYQAPRDPAVQFAKNGGPTADNPAVSVRWNMRAGDEAETAAANYFCQNRVDRNDFCTYKIDGWEVDSSDAKVGTAPMEEIGDNPAPTAVRNQLYPIGGVREGYFMRVCNYGGCADGGPLSYQTAACQFAPDTRSMEWVQENNLHRWQNDGPRSDTSVSGTLKFGWLPSCGNDSRGISGYRWGRVPVAGTDPHNRTLPSGFNPNDPSTGTFVSPTSPLNTGAQISTPGAAYTYYVWAIAKNGTATPITKGQSGAGQRMLASPAHVAFEQVGRTCLSGSNPGVANGWRDYFEASLFGRSAQRDVNISRLQTAWLARGIPQRVWNDMGADDNALLNYLVSVRDDVRYSSTNPEIQDPREWFAAGADTAAKRRESGVGPYWNNASITRSRGKDLEASDQLSDGRAGQTPATTPMYQAIFPDNLKYVGVPQLRVVPWIGNVATSGDARDLPVPGYAMIVSHQTVIEPGTLQIDIGGANKFTSPTYESIDRSYRDTADGPTVPGTCYQYAGAAPALAGDTTWTLRSGTAWQGQYAGVHRSAVPDSTSGNRWDRTPSTGTNFTAISPRY